MDGGPGRLPAIACQMAFHTVVLDRLKGTAPNVRT